MRVFYSQALLHVLVFVLDAKIKIFGSNDDERDNDDYDDDDDRDADSRRCDVNGGGKR